jgi:hypothetical protein
VPQPTFNINDIVAPVGKQPANPFAFPTPAQQNPRRVAQEDAATAIKNRNKDINSLIEGGDFPSPTPTPKPQPPQYAA